ncbi:hypothetical protein DFS33DRAFT_1384834 [Desarmillaria ectypa]|nr:hypothetical protein DFS33DRAFT_1384834 [Desarmillaria ectypa]
MIECAICYDLLTDPYAAVCGHIFCLACIDKWFAYTAQQRLVFKCPNCNLAICKRSVRFAYQQQSHPCSSPTQLRKVYIAQSQALVEELSTLRIQVKDLDACNASLKTELEGLRTEVESYQSLTEELLADMYVDDDNPPQKRNRVAYVIYGIFTSTVFLQQAILLRVASAFYDAITSAGSALLLQIILLGIEIVWRVVTRPKECLREVALYVWVFTDVIASGLVLPVVLLGILCGDYECMVIWLDFGYPRLCGLVECMRRKSSTYLVRQSNEQ